MTHELRQKLFLYQMIKWPWVIQQFTGLLFLIFSCYYFHIFSVFNRLNSNFSLSFQVLMKF